MVGYQRRCGCGAGTLEAPGLAASTASPPDPVAVRDRPGDRSGHALHDARQGTRRTSSSSADSPVSLSRVRDHALKTSWTWRRAFGVLQRELLADGVRSRARGGRFHGVPTEREIDVMVEAFGAKVDDGDILAGILDAALADPVLMGPAISSQPNARLVGMAATVHATSETEAPLIAANALGRAMRSAGAIDGLVDVGGPPRDDHMSPKRPNWWRAAA